VRSHNEVRTLFAKNKVRFARAEQQCLLANCSTTEHQQTAWQSVNQLIRSLYRFCGLLTAKKNSNLHFNYLYKSIFEFCISCGMCEAIHQSIIEYFESNASCVNGQLVNNEYRPSYQ